MLISVLKGLGLSSFPSQRRAAWEEVLTNYAFGRKEEEKRKRARLEEASGGAPDAAACPPRLQLSCAWAVSKDVASKDFPILQGGGKLSYGSPIIPLSGKEPDVQRNIIRSMFLILLG